MGRPIKDIKDKDLNQLVYPKTHIKAVAVDNYSNLEDYLNNSGFVTSEDAGYDVNGVQLSFATPAEAQSYADTAKQAAINYSKQYTEEQISSSINSLNSQIQNSLNSLETELTAAISDNNDVILDMVDQTITDRLGDVDVEVPTLTSQLTNDSGFITEAPSDDVIYGRKNGEWVDVNQEFEPIGTIKTSEVGNVFGDKYVACNGALLDLADYPDLVSNFPVNTNSNMSEMVGTVIYIWFCGGYFWASTNQKYLYRSTDGVNWQAVISKSAEVTASICYFKGMFIATGGSNSIYQSQDGITWNLIQLNGTPRYVACTESIVFATYSGEVSYNNFVSTDGINWEKAANIPQYNSNEAGALCMFSLNNYIYIVYHRNNVYSEVLNFCKRTSDGINWEQVPQFKHSYSSDAVTSRLYEYNNEYYIYIGGVYKTGDGISWVNSGLSGPICTFNNSLIANTTIIGENNIQGAYSSPYQFATDGNILLLLCSDYSFYKLHTNKYQVPTIANSYIKVLK